jgi:hypothetical protein
LFGFQDDPRKSIYRLLIVLPLGAEKDKGIVNVWVIRDLAVTVLVSVQYHLQRCRRVVFTPYEGVDVFLSLA